jgi:hypothetical protein
VEISARQPATIRPKRLILENADAQHLAVVVDQLFGWFDQLAVGGSLTGSLGCGSRQYAVAPIRIRFASSFAHKNSHLAIEAAYGEDSTGKTLLAPRDSTRRVLS